MAQVRVKWGGEPYIREITAGEHTWLADEPEEKGGRNAGPTPYDLLLSALGACISITVQMYARRKEWPLEGMLVTLDGRHLPQADPGQPGYEIDVSIRLEGPLSPEQYVRLAEIANRCPVKKTLTRGVDVKTQALPQG